MVVECPKCHETVQFQAAQIDECSEIVCESCLTALKMQVVPAVVTAQEDAMVHEVPEVIEDVSETQTEVPLEAEESDVFMAMNDDQSVSNDEQLQDAEEAPLSGEMEMAPVADEVPLETAVLSSKPAEDDQDKILVCIDGEATREMVGDLLKDSSFRLIDIPSEMNALMAAEIEAPKLALIDSDLFGEDDVNLVAELKKNPALKDTLFILVGSMFEKDTKYRKEPPQLKGAQAYIGRYALQNKLLDEIRRIMDLKAGVLSHETDAFPQGNMGSGDMESNDDDSFEMQDDSIDTEEDVKKLQEAQRLARIIVSDILIYNQAKAEEGIRTNRFYEILEDEIEEGRQLFESRVSKDLRFSSDCYEKALQDAIRTKQAERSQDNQGTEAVSDTNIQDPSLDFSDVMVSDPEHETTVYAPSISDKASRAQAQVEDSEEVKNAKRLARIIVSDIVIYNEKKVEEGLQNDTFYELLEEEIEEGRQLYASRVDKRFLNETDYLQQAFDDFINKKKTSVASE